MAFKAPKIKAPKIEAPKIEAPKMNMGVNWGIDRTSPIKGVSDMMGQIDPTNPSSIYGRAADRAEYMVGGKKKQSTKDAEQEQIDIGKKSSEEVGGVFDKMKESDDEYLRSQTGATDTYKNTRNQNMDTYSKTDEADTGTYRTARDAANKTQIEGTDKAGNTYKTARDAATTKQLGAVSKAGDDYKGSRNAANTKQLEQDAAATKTYRDTRNPLYEKYQKQLTGLSDAASSQASDATKTYQNNIQPRLQNIMSDAETQAGSAMSLADAGDPNNKVNKSWQDLYESKAQGVNKQALQNVGVMNALGSQATANQLGNMGGALSTNAMLALQGQNMAQSGQAFARSQQQMQALREQGLDVGRQESAAQYERGQGAKDRYAGSVRDFAQGDADYQDRMADYRRETGGYQDKGFATGKELVQDDYGIDKDRSVLEGGMSRDAAAEDFSIGKDYAGLEGGLSRGAAGENFDIDKDQVGLAANLSRGAASENLSQNQVRNQKLYDFGDRRGTEDMGIASGLAGAKHGMAADDAGRRISNINQKYSIPAQVAQTQAGVGYQQQAAGPQILAGLAGAGAQMYGASQAGGGGGGTRAAAGAAPPAQAPQPQVPEGAYDDPTKRRGSAWGQYG